jgi:hypothetical protein
MSNPNPIPPPIPASALPISASAMNENPADRTPISSVSEMVESLLRHPGRLLFQLGQPGSGYLMSGLVLMAVLCALVYGIIVGTFSGGAQLWAAPAKTAAGLLLSALICLPSLYIFSCLGGSQARLVEVFGLLAGFLALLTVLLIGFAPVAWVFSQSTQSAGAMGALHVVFFLIAFLFGLRFLLAGFAQRSTRRAGLHVWAFILLLVLLQMTTALRPLIGTADTFLPKEKKFFLAHWIECLK